jgi:hypothetical protein
MKRLLMAEEWDKFARGVIPADAPKVQKQEMRRAFYAGAQSILFRVIQSFAPDSEPTDADVQIMENLHQELQDFAALVKAGRA